MTTVATQTPAYVALTQGAALQPRSGHGLLTLGDADRVDFLQRMTTNDIAGLGPGQAAVTVLTSPVARIEFVFTVLHRGETLWLLPAAGQAAALTRKLRSQIFFMDKVSVADVSSQRARLRLMGPRGQELLLAAGLPVPPQDNVFLDEAGVTVLRQEEYDVPGYELILEAEAAANLQARLVDAGAIVLTGPEAYTARRVELARPLPGAELSGDVNPLEAGMAWACAEDKGCYTGQEIIARQRTYDKVTKTLVLLGSESLATPGAPVTVDGRRVGVITSSAYSPAQGAPRALAILRRPHNQPGRVVTVDGQSATVLEAVS